VLYKYPLGAILVEDFTRLEESGSVLVTLALTVQALMVKALIGCILFHSEGQYAGSESESIIPITALILEES
jgi:hypothetical protein